MVTLIEAGRINRYVAKQNDKWPVDAPNGSVMYLIDKLKWLVFDADAGEWNDFVMPGAQGGSGGTSGALTDDDAIALLTERGVVTPAADENGQLLCSDSGEIYTV